MNNASVAKSAFDLEFTEPAQADQGMAIEELRAMVLPTSSLRAMGVEVAAAKDLGMSQTLGDSLKAFIQQLTEGLSRAADDLSSLEVRTFSTDDIAQVSYDYGTGQFSGPVKVRALTRIAFDGDIQVILPEKEGELDASLWAAHVAMVKEAQANRAQFLGAMAEMATRLIALFSRP